MNPQTEACRHLAPPYQLQGKNTNESLEQLLTAKLLFYTLSLEAHAFFVVIAGETTSEQLSPTE